MPRLANGTAEELAQKYQEKALARRRGAGTHQPKFRGFTVGRKSEVNSAEDATVPQTTTITTLRHETQATELQTTVPEVSQDPPPPTVSRPSSGFNERYQERLKSRFRGAGAHQPEFRGFTLKPLSKNSGHGQSKTSEPARAPTPPIPSPTHNTPELSPPQSPIIIPKAIKRRAASPSLANPTLSKPATTTQKKRRLIREETEEVDENENPWPLQDRSTDNVTRMEMTKSSSHASSRGAPTTRSSETTKSAQETSRSLRQTTLMQLSSKPSRKGDGALEPHSRDDHVTTVSDEGDSDFERHFERMTVKSSKTSKKKAPTKPSTRSTKGPSEKTVKNYKQLQIHCLKFWGPFGAASRPATVRNKETAKKLPVQGETSTSQEAGSSQKVQSVLQFEDAPLSEMDVIAEAVRDVVDTFIDSIEDQAMAKELMTMRSELETVLIEQVDMLDDHTLLKASVKKAAAVKKELRVRLLETQRQRQKTRQELKRVRASFEREERARRRLEDTHNFLTDLEALRDHIVGSDDENESGNVSENEQTKDHENDNLKTGLQSLIATVGSRCGKAATSEPTNTPSNMLKTLQEFNQLLEDTGKHLQSMPLVNPSQQPTASMTLGDDFMDDFDIFGDF